ncbi:Protein of unknown function [Gryllus bimaculatus]|nr:Protein of unknown function [Gryllus bimaculatus]
MQCEGLRRPLQRRYSALAYSLRRTEGTRGKRQHSALRLLKKASLSLDKAHF